MNRPPLPAPEFRITATRHLNGHAGAEATYSTWDQVKQAERVLRAVGYLSVIVTPFRTSRDGRGPR